jgi:hypothetical protein
VNFKVAAKREKQNIPKSSGSGLLYPMLFTLTVTFHPLTNYSSPFCFALCVYDESGSGYR